MTHVTDVRLLLGSSPPMLELADQLNAFAAADHAILLVGETGVGKSRAALAIHARSARSQAAFLELDCGQRPAGVLAQEVEGRLASTGATVYFEEIAELPASVQLSLLNGLDAADAARVIASSERDLATEVTEARFNEALYYRLGAHALHLPPLRARAPEDIRESALALMAELRRGLPGSPREIAERAMVVITRYHWPGNIRELRNVLERGLLLARGAPSVDVMHLPAGVLEASEGVAHAHVSRTLAEVERTHIERTLRAHAANRTRAARDLGISRATLIKKIRDYHVADHHDGKADTQENE